MDRTGLTPKHSESIRDNPEFGLTEAIISSSGEMKSTKTSGYTHSKETTRTLSRPARDPVIDKLGCVISIIHSGDSRNDR
jgi:hypothetical protein